MRLVLISDTHNLHARLDVPDGDVLITHGPPHGILDRTFRGEQAGCADLRDALRRVRPKLHVFGHIHEGYGQTTDPEFGTIFINASADGYRALNPPIVVDL